MEFDPGALGYFTVAVKLAELLIQGFGLSDVKLVPWAWQIVDGQENLFGWVVLLRDNRRVYLRYRVDESKDVDVNDLHLETLQRGVRRPVESDPAVHWLIPRHVNRALGLPDGEPDRPEDLRELAHRARYLAAAVAEPDRSRMHAYADELEEIAAALNGDTAGVAIGTTRPALN